MSTLVALCAGSAAVAMASRGCAAPFRYMGGKGRIAKPIIEHMEIGRPDRIVLVDPGPCGKAWQGLIAHQEDVATELAYIADMADHGEWWQKTASEPVPEGLFGFTLAFLALQHLNWRSKPVGVVDGRWTTSGLDRTMAYGLPGTERFGAVRPQLLSLPGLVDSLDLQGVEAHHCRAEDMAPIPDSDAYCDPPYVDTQAYQHDLGRVAVLALRDRHVAAGCRFSISEAQPIEGMRSVLVGRQGASQGLTSGKPRRDEWLSMSFEASQLGLWGAA